MSTGTAAFAPGAFLPYHVHPCSEVISILTGELEMLVEGRCYRLGRLDTLHLPAGVPHAARNPSARVPAMALGAFASEHAARHDVETDYPETSRDATVAGDPEHLTRWSEIG